MDKESAFKTGDEASIPGVGRCPGGGNGSPLQYPCLENPTDRGAWWATVHGITKSQTRLSHSACTNLCVNSQLLMDPSSLIFFVFISISFFSLFLCLFLLGRAVRLYPFLDSNKSSPMMLTSPCLCCFSGSDRFCFLLSDWTWHSLLLAHG